MDEILLMDNMNLIAGYLFSWLSKIFTLYTGNLILSAVFCLWILRKVAKLFERL